MEKGAEATGNSLSVNVNPDVQEFVSVEDPEKVLSGLPEHHVGESVEHHTEPLGLIENIRSSNEAIKRQPGEDSTSSIRFLRARRFLDKERSQLEPAA